MGGSERKSDVVSGSPEKEQQKIPRAQPETSPRRGSRDGRNSEWGPGAEGLAAAANGGAPCPVHGSWPAGPLSQQQPCWTSLASLETRQAR